MRNELGVGATCFMRCNVIIGVCVCVCVCALNFLTPTHTYPLFHCCPVQCSAACNACHLRDPAERCRKDNIHNQPDRKHDLDDDNLEYMHYNRSAPIYAPGDLNRMFESIQHRLEKRYSINYLSRSPYIVTIDNFLNDQEVCACVGCACTAVCGCVCVCCSG
jgi:hypothetical protein